MQRLCHYLGHLLSFHVSVDDAVYVNVARPFITPGEIWNLRAAQSFVWVGMEGEVTGSGDGPREGMDASVGR